MVDAQGFRGLLAAAGLTQAEFARRIGASVQCVNAWAAGRLGRHAERPALAYRLAVMLLEVWVAEKAAAPKEGE